MKKLLSVFLLIAFTFAFYACGESTGESNENLEDKLQQEMLMEESGELPEPEHSFLPPLCPSDWNHLQTFWPRVHGRHYS